MNEDKENIALLILFILALAFVVFVPNSDIPKTQTYYEHHIVKQGETLSEIVQMYGGSLIKTQSINSNVIMPGEKIRVVVEQ